MHILAILRVCWLFIVVVISRSLPLWALGRLNWDTRASRRFVAVVVSRAA